MKPVNQKYDKINLLKLLAQEAVIEWHTILDKCERNQDLERLKGLMYGICWGMDDIAKQKLNTPKMCEIFAILVRSIEVKVKRIYRKKYPCLLDSGKKLTPAQLKIYDVKKEMRNKKTRDLEFQNFLRDARP